MGSSLISTIFWIISIVSWLFFLVTGWIGFIKFVIINYKSYIVAKISYNAIWSFLYAFYKIILSSKEYEKFFPLNMNFILLAIVFGILLAIGTFAFIVYIIKTTIKKEESIFDGMVGTFSRYHFIPLICAGCLFIIGIDIQLYCRGESEEGDELFKSMLERYVFNLIFSIIGLLCLVFVKMKTNAQQPFYIAYSIKDGLYSCLIPLFTYCFFYSIIYVGICDKTKRAYGNSDLSAADRLELLRSIDSFIKTCSIIFSILIGIVNICFGVILRDIVIPFINLLIYLGLVIFFYSFDKDNRENDSSSSEAVGIIEIVMLVLSLIGITFGVFNKVKGGKRL